MSHMSGHANTITYVYICIYMMCLCIDLLYMGVWCVHTVYIGYFFGFAPKKINLLAAMLLIKLGMENTSCRRNNCALDA